uniref:Uncharacterized protein n=2 Tax=Sus scrofa TaxID=9823 RepID=A0A8D1LQ93_PIG
MGAEGATEGWGGAARGGPDSEMKVAGGGLQAQPASWPGFQVSRGKERTGERSGSPPALPPSRRTSPVARLCVSCCLPGPFFLTSPTLALTICSLYFSPFSSRAPAAAEEPSAQPPARASLPCPTVRPLGSARAPDLGFATGSEPSGCGYRRWAAESEAFQAGTLDFPSPTFLSPPFGICSSSSCGPARRGSTTWRPKNYKSLHPPRRGRERRGAERSDALWLEMETNKENGGGRLHLF